MKLLLVVLGGALALVSVADTAAAQQRAAVASATRPRPLTTRPMGVPASVQPVGRPSPAGAPVVFPFPLYGGSAVTIVAPLVLTRPVTMVSVAFPPPTGCAVVEVETPDGPWRSAVVLPALGADTTERLLSAIRRRIGEGRGVSLTATNGTRIRIPAGPGTGDVAVEACPAPPEGS